MRQGHDGHFITNDVGEVIGISLGADFVSEHEWGIKGIKDMMGVSETRIKKGLLGKEAREELYGIDRRTCHKFPELYIKTGTINQKKAMVVICDMAWNMQYLNGANIRDVAAECELFPYNDGDNLCTAWDESSFGICATGKYIEQLQKIVDIWKSEDVAIWVNRSGAFKNGGLVIIKASAVPDNKRKDMYDADTNAAKLVAAAEKTGIKKKLEKAGKQFFALSPRWTKDFHGAKTQYEVMFWLNPMQQENNNYGYFSVEDLLLWTEDKGPIPIK